MLPAGSAGDDLRDQAIEHHRLTGHKVIFTRGTMEYIGEGDRPVPGVAAGMSKSSPSSRPEFGPAPCGKPVGRASAGTLPEKEM